MILAVFGTLFLPFHSRWFGGIAGRDVPTFLRYGRLFLGFGMSTAESTEGVNNTRNCGNLLKF